MYIRVANHPYLASMQRANPTAGCSIVDDKGDCALIGEVIMDIDFELDRVTLVCDGHYGVMTSMLGELRVGVMEHGDFVRTASPILQYTMVWGGGIADTQWVPTSLKPLVLGSRIKSMTLSREVLYLLTDRLITLMFSIQWDSERQREFIYCSQDPG